MISMKEPPLSRRKNPTTTTNHYHAAQPTSPTNHHHRTHLKLVCRFNGAFHLRQPSGLLHYSGGDAKIVTVVRPVSFSKLLSKISGLSPGIASFVIRYQLPYSVSDPAAAAAQLVRLDSDDDVRRMVDAFDKLESCGMSVRLKLFVCSANGVGSCHRVGSETRTRLEDVKAAAAVKKQDSLRRIVLKQVAKQSGPGPDSGLGRASESEGETKQCEAYEPLPTDLESYCDNVAQFSVGRSSPLNPRDGNLRGDQALGKVLCNGVGVADQSALAMQGLKPVKCSGVMKPGSNGFHVKKDMGKNGVDRVLPLSEVSIKEKKGKRHKIEK